MTPTNSDNQAQPVINYQPTDSKSIVGQHAGGGGVADCGCPPQQVCDKCCGAPAEAVWLMPVATQEPQNSRLLQYAWGRSNLSTGQIAHAYNCIVSAAQECGQTIPTRRLATAEQPATGQAGERLPTLDGFQGLHPDTLALVRRFAYALACKLSAAETKYGYSDGWARDDWMDECREKLVEHVAKGDPRDVAAYCAFLWHHDERTSLPAATGQGVPAGWVLVPRKPTQAMKDAGVDSAVREANGAPWFPFAWRAALAAAPTPPAGGDDMVLVNGDALMRLTEPLAEHPEDWNGPCWCATCRSYAAEDAPTQEMRG